MTPTWTVCQFSVPGTPVSQGSKVAMPYTRKSGKLGVYMAEDKSRRDKLATWRASCRLAAANAMGEGFAPLEGAVYVTCTFQFARPKSHMTTKGMLRKGQHEAHLKKPDIDKLSRAVLDSLTGVVWRDDNQVVHLSAMKRYGEPGVSVQVEAWK